MAINKIYIPTFVADQYFSPARVRPRAFFYNGLLDAPTWVFNHWNNSVGSSISLTSQDYIPIVDHYNAESGSLPNSGSQSLLFQNEATTYGTIPQQSLFSEYWSTYIDLLYNPVTRLINASAIIPTADYLNIELNDIVEWRGNMYHLRAINEYNLSTGECTLQLLGPIIEDSLDEIIGNRIPPNTTTTTSTTSTTTTSTTTTTTSTTTTTTTTAAAGYYYLAEQYGCSPCEYLEDVLIFSTTTRSPGRYYNNGDGFVYSILVSAPPNPTIIDLSSAPFNFDCDLACAL